MTDSDTKALLDSLMARRGNAPEFILELEGYRDDLTNGELDSADIKYIRDLAKRLGSGVGGDAMEPVESPGDGENDADGDDNEEDDETGGDSRFARAKAAFRERFHPDGLDPDAPDAAVRREIYEEFWAELERIEGQGSGIE